MRYAHLAPSNLLAAVSVLEQQADDATPQGSSGDDEEHYVELWVRAGV
jgi:hypothetical protein